MATSQILFLDRKERENGGEVIEGREGRKGYLVGQKRLENVNLAKFRGRSSTRILAIQACDCLHGIFLVANFCLYSYILSPHCTTLNESP